MVTSHWEGLPVEAENQCRFKFCRSCPLYACELVGEYEQFAETHGQSCEQTRRGSVQVVHDDQVIRYGVSKPATDHDGQVIRYGVSKPVTDKDLEQKWNTVVESHSEPTYLSYDPEELKNGCFMSKQHVYPIECGRQRVTEGIGEHFKIELNHDSTIRANTDDRWEPLQPVFISAQTGQGKNYFIENTLIPYVRNLNYENKTKQRILVLSNRLALQQQIKNRLDGGDNSADEEISAGPYKGFGDVADVMTYQSLLHQEKRLKKKQKDASSRYIYVICDEAHFFTSDAMFNPHTSRILSTIVRLFKDAIRVYMSATPYECLEYITNVESGHMVFYHFKRDYSYLDVKTYSSIDELYEQIVDSVNRRKEKWLIFIDDKQKGATVKAKLLEYEAESAKEPAEESAKGKKKAESKEKRILVVNADSKVNETYMSIVKDEKLGAATYVLITTSVLDNGVNLNGIKNIVISDMSKVKCLQMAGRARISDPADRKTLYIKRFGGGEVESRIGALERQQDAYHSYELAYGELRDLEQRRGRSEYQFLDRYYNGSAKDWENAKCWFGRPIDRPTELYLNEIAKSLLDRLIQQYQTIYDEMDAERSKAESADQYPEKESHIGQKYLEYQLSWFGKTYSEENDITFADKDKAKKEFVAFLESYAASGEQIEGPEEMKAFQANFMALYDAAYPRADKNRDRIYGYKVMNDRLKKLNIGYEITGPAQKGPWTVTTVSTNQENPEQTETPSIEDTSRSLQ